MTSIKFLLILFALSINLHCFYISKQPVPALFLNQQFRFNITHNAGPNANFKLLSGPSFLTLKTNGEMTFLPKNQGSFQAIIQCINSSTNSNLITLSYVLNVLNKSKQQQKRLWILNQQNYMSQLNEKSLQISTDSFDFRAPIMTNENIRLKLTTKNDIGQVVWFYENLPQTIIASKSTGVIQGYVETEGTQILKVTAIDSTFRMGQIYIFLKFTQIPLSLQHDSYSEYNWKSSFLVQQKQQNAMLLENEIKSLVNQKNDLKSKKNQLLNTYKNISLSKQQNKLSEGSFTQKIKIKKDDLSVRQGEKNKIQTDLNNQKSEVDKARKVLSDKQKDYGTKIEQSKRANLTHEQTVIQLKNTKIEFESIKNDISNLQSVIFKSENEIRDIQYQKSRSNVTYVTFQREQVRSRQILQIRKNIEFQYIIKKAQTDNKVRRNEDYVFLAQTNYDFAYADYKKQSLLYLQHVIESSYLQTQIQLALKDYDEMKKILNRVKLNYAIAQGAVNTLKVAKQQLSKLSAYALNSAIINTSNTLSQTQIIQAQAKIQVQEYPFTGCQKIGNFAWAGSGKIKTIGKNSLILGSQETLNFGKCTQIRTNMKGVSQAQAGQWIQFNGYYWDGAIQATSITLLSIN